MRLPCTSGGPRKGGRGPRQRRSGLWISTPGTPRRSPWGSSLAAWPRRRPGPPWAGAPGVQEGARVLPAEGGRALFSSPRSRLTPCAFSRGARHVRRTDSIAFGLGTLKAGLRKRHTLEPTVACPDAVLLRFQSACSWSRTSTVSTPHLLLPAAEGAYPEPISQMRKRTPAGCGSGPLLTPEDAVSCDRGPDCRLQPRS